VQDANGDLALLLRGRIWSVYSLALTYQVTSAVWRLAGSLPSRLLQNTPPDGRLITIYVLILA
jgi:hypothetical protein